MIVIKPSDLSAVANRQSLFAFLCEHLRWPVDAEDLYTYPVEIPVGSRLHAGVSRIVPFTGRDPYAVFLLESDGELKRRDLREALRLVRADLREHARDGDKAAASVEKLVFVCASKGYEEMRFVRFVQQEGRQPRIRSFGWEREHADETRTVREICLPALVMKKDRFGQIDWQAATWEQAWDVERVTREFYSRFQQLHVRVETAFRAEAGTGDGAREAALQFLSRLLFLFFIQRKRYKGDGYWLGSDGRFLQRMLGSYEQEAARGGFYRLWLAPLFFEALCDKFQASRHDYVARFPAEIRTAMANAPHLNGGLFRANHLDDRYTELPDETVKEAIGFFASYNFVVREATPMDVDVDVDPEMIGRIYEGLVNQATADREEADLGVHYTPRTEIDLMCRLAVRDWLSKRLGAEQRALITEWVFTYGGPERKSIWKRIRDHNLWPQLKSLLEAVKVCDPACGSGSFLVGMLLVLDDLLAQADEELGHTDTVYDRRRGILRRSLFGADVAEWAVRVAELRLWLQLVVETELTRPEAKVKPLLPNLSFNLRVGDSVVQEVGGLDLGAYRLLEALPPAMKGRITALRGRKVEYFEGRQGLTREGLLREEAAIFREIAKWRLERTKQLRDAIVQNAPRGGAYSSTIGGPPLAAASGGQGTSLSEIDAELRELQDYYDELHRESVPPFVWEVAFAECFSGDEPGFDIVIGNPPYVRNERIQDPAGRIDAPAYRAKLVRAIAARWPDFFGFRARGGTIARKPDGHADLYIYFYFRTLGLLNRHGVHCFIVSNSWLDVQYGSDLQEFLCRHAGLRLVLDCDQRTFERADINTVITLADCPSPGELDSAALEMRTASFVKFKVPYLDVLDPVPWLEIDEATGRCERPEFVARRYSLKALLDGGSAVKAGRRRYVGDKWHGKYIRAPEVYWQIVERAGDRLVPLHQVAEVRRGLTSGANDFFYVRVESVRDGVATVRCDDGSVHQIEEQFVREPALVKAGEITRPRIDPAELRYRLVRLPADGPLPPLAAAYVAWGEGKGFHKRPSTSGRRRWYAIELDPRVDLAIPCGQARRVVVGTVRRAAIVVDKRMYTVTAFDPSHAPLLSAALRTTFSMLDREVVGRANLGEGMLELTVYEMERLLVPDPVACAEGDLRRIVSAHESAAEQEIGTIYDEVCSGSRAALDHAFLEALGFPAAVYGQALAEETCRIVWTRMAKAGSNLETRLSYADWRASGRPFADGSA